MTTDSWLVVFNGLLVVVGVTQACFLWRALKATEKAASAAKQSAEAAEKSSEVAKLALKGDRPYLLVEKTELHGIYTGETNEAFASMASSFNVFPKFMEYKKFRPRATFHLRNYGKGPALLDEVVMRLRLMKEPPPPKDFTECSNFAINVGAIGAGEPWTIRTSARDAMITKQDYESVDAGTKTIIAYGCIKYRDVFDNPYETGFCWLLNPPTRVDLSGNIPVVLRGPFSHGPKTHNYST